MLQASSEKMVVANQPVDTIFKFLGFDFEQNQETYIEVVSHANASAGKKYTRCAALWCGPAVEWRTCQKTVRILEQNQYVYLGANAPPLYAS